jgi:rhamnose utilization protein RhaD (predicted bifunctional aldolase and dehydrogenase)
MKKYLKYIVVVVVLIGVFSFGAFTGASSDWKSEVINEASQILNGKGYEKKAELVGRDGENVEAEMKAAINPEIVASQEELARLLEEYYQFKIDGLTESEEFAQLESRIEQIKGAVLERYKGEIDQIFEGL